MNRMICDYPLDYIEKQGITLPPSADFLTVQLTNKGYRVFTREDTPNEYDTMRDYVILLVAGTGEVPPGAKYLNTTMTGMVPHHWFVL